MSNRNHETDTIEAPSARSDSLRQALSDIFADLDAAVIAADEQGHIVMVNAAMRQLFGYTESELLGSRAEMIQADGNDFVARGRARYDAHARLKQSSYNSRCRHSDGSLFDAEIIVGPIRDPGDGDILYLAIIRDTSVRRPAEKALGMLHGISTDQDLDFAQRRQALLDLGCNYFGLTTGIINRIDGDRCEAVEVVDAAGVVQRGDSWPIGHTYSRCVLERDGPLGVDGTNRTRLRRQVGVPYPRPESYIGCPITVAGERYGTLDFSSLEAGGLFGPSDLDLVATLAQRIGEDIFMERRLAALRDAHDKLSRVATIDELTGLGNRRLLVRQLDFEIERGRRHRRSLSVALIDFDDFEQFRTADGRDLGDAALRHLADRARYTLRGSDLIGRWDGHAFLLLLPDTPSRAATVSLSRLLDNIRSFPLEVNGESLLLSVSAGVTTSACNESSDMIVQRADEALRQAMAAGCNQVAKRARPKRVRAKT